MLPRALLVPSCALLTLASTCVSPLPQAPSSSTGASSSSSSSAPPPRTGITAWTMPERPTCAEGYLAPVARAALGEAQLLEASGLVASPSQPDVLWLHNDSGDSARLFAVATDGRALGALALPNLAAIDIEDLAAGPCPDLSGPCLYASDTGDNKLKREELVVYAVPEPFVAPDRPLAENAEAPFVWIFPLVIPERANVEALIVLPDASAMLLFEKTEGEQARIFRYRAPWTPLIPATVEVTATLAIDAPLPPLRQITAADVHPSGTRVLLRTYAAVYEARLDLAAGVGAERLDRVELAQVVTGLEEPQGEAVAYDSAGTGIWTVSESPSGEPGPPLHHAACAATPAAP